MNEKPKIKIELTKSDLIIEIINVIFLLLFWFLTISSYSNLPEMIPINYDFFTGKANVYGDKAFIFLSPLIATLLCIALTILNKFPHIFNYPIDITQENALQQYTIATKLLRFTKLMVILFCALIYFVTSGDNNEQFADWILLVTFALPAVQVIGYFIAVYRSSSNAVIEKIEQVLYFSLLICCVIVFFIFIKMVLNRGL